MKEKKSYKRWEKIFIITSISVIMIIFFIYLYRLIYYYRLEHIKFKVNTLIQELTSNVTSSNDGLYILDEDNYFYKGVNVNNYVWYSGNLYRIVSINGTNIKLISDSNLTTISWGSGNKFDESYLYTWLNNTEETKSVYLESVFNNQVYLKEFNVCNDSINKNCVSDKKYLVSLLTRSEYLNAGGKLSYLNNESNYWIIDDTNEIEKAYVFTEGGIGSETTETTLASYGVRPVITINGNITNFKGTGTKEDPYNIIDELGETISEKKIGEYVTYGGYTFRLLEKQDEGAKLILDGTLDGLSLNYNDTVYYLNNTFRNKFSNLGTCTYNTGKYGSKTAYNYKNTYIETSKGSIGLPSIGGLYVGNNEEYWLVNVYDVNTTLVYKLNSNSTIIADTKSSKNSLKPILCVKKDIKITSGDGTKNSPYVLGE